MALVYQKNRGYSLIVGDIESGEGFEVRDLNISFDVTKTSNNKDRTNSATIEIYNLSSEKQKFLEEDYIAAVLSAGYYDTTIKRLFAGQVTKATTRKSGTDIISQIQIGTAYVELNHSTVKKLIPPGKDAEYVISELAKDIPGVSKVIFNSINIKSPLLDGYPLSGTNREILDEISKTYDVEWQIDDDVLYITDAGGTFTEDLNTAFVISPTTGMIERPYAVSGDERRTKKDKAKKAGIQVKILLNPEIVPGSIVKLEDTLYDGYYRVASLRTFGQYRGNDWYTELRCEDKIKV